MTALLKPATLADLLGVPAAPVPAHVPPACTPLLEVRSERTEILNRALGAEMERRTDEMDIRFAGGDATEAQAALQDAETRTRIVEMIRQESLLALWHCVLAE